MNPMDAQKKMVGEILAGTELKGGDKKFIKMESAGGRALQCIRDEIVQVKAGLAVFTRDS